MLQGKFLSPKTNLLLYHQVGADENQGVSVGDQCLGGDPGSVAGGADGQAQPAGGEAQQHHHEQPQHYSSPEHHQQQQLQHQCSPKHQYLIQLIAVDPKQHDSCLSLTYCDS